MTINECYRKLIDTIYGSKKQQFYPSKGNIDRAIKTLSPKEEYALRLRFGLDDGNPKTLQEIAQPFSYSREWARWLCSKAMRKMRVPSKSAEFNLEPKPISDDDPIDILDISVRSFNGLKGGGIATIGQLKALRSSQIIRLKYIGHSSYADICKAMRDCGISPVDGFNKEMMGQQVVYFDAEDVVPMEAEYKVGEGKRFYAVCEANGDIAMEDEDLAEDRDDMHPLIYFSRQRAEYEARNPDEHCHVEEVEIFISRRKG